MSCFPDFTEIRVSRTFPKLLITLAYSCFFTVLWGSAEEQAGVLRARTSPSSGIPSGHSTHLWRATCSFLKHKSEMFSQDPMSHV